MVNSRRFFQLNKSRDEEGNMQVLLQLDTELIRKRALRVLTPSQLKVLLAIASHMDENGVAFPSMRYLSEITGIATNTVNSAIKGLLDIRIDGVPIITRKLEGSGSRKRSKYSFVVNEDSVEESNNAVELEVQRMSPKTLLLYFCEEYEKEYQVSYRPNWGRDTKNIKSFMNRFENDEEAKEIIRVGITEYKTRWASPQFPTPTIGSICGWIAGNVVDIVRERAKRATRVNKQNTGVDDDFSFD